MDEDPADLAATYRLPMLMVGELHGRGYERLRAYFMLSPSGVYWRCNVGPSCVAEARHGGLLQGRYFTSTLAAIYTSGNGTTYFGIEGGGLSAAELADQFEGSFPKIIEAARGEDGDYVAWYRQMLQLTAPNVLPFAMADFEIPEDRLDYLSVGPSPEGIVIPLPPFSLDVGACGDPEPPG